MLIAATAVKPKTIAAFSAVGVEARLRDELTAAAKVEAGLRGVPWPQEADVQSAGSHGLVCRALVRGRADAGVRTI